MVEFQQSSRSKVRWRTYEQANKLEKDLASWIVEDVFPSRHTQESIRHASFSRQRLFECDTSLQYLFVLPSTVTDYPNFYIVYMEGTDNPAVIGDNLIAQPLLYIHNEWLRRAKLLSSVIDGVWVGYIWNGEQYIEHRPGATSLANKEVSVSIQKASLMIRGLAITQRSARIATRDWRGQYIYKFDDMDYSYKLAADLHGPTAVLTQSSVYSGKEPEIWIVNLVENGDASIYPLGIGCPVDCFIYSFDDYQCQNARNVKFYFSKTEIDLYGDEVTGFVMGYIGPDLNCAQNYQRFYPCTRT